MILFGTILPVTLCLFVSEVTPSDSFKRVEAVSDSFWLEWEIFPPLKKAEFTVNAETKGFVGFGISRSGGMNGADIFIGGVDQDGVPYYGDYFGNENGAPVKDQQQDWDLIQAKEEDNTTFLKFSRNWNTCDEMDVAINNDSINFIWAIGESDRIEYHKDMRL